MFMQEQEKGWTSHTHSLGTWLLGWKKKITRNAWVYD